MAKRAELCYLTNDHHPFILTLSLIAKHGSTDSSVNTAEFILLIIIATLRKDKLDGYGSVLLAFLNTLNITECPLVDMYNYEIIAATLTYIWGTENYFSTYRPPTTGSTYLPPKSYSNIY